MKKGNFEEIDKRLYELYDDIFWGINVSELSAIEKRKTIYDYLVQTIKYDYDLLEGIKNNQDNSKPKIIRDLSEEIMSVLYKNKGICNAISQVYKLLLEKVNIYSMCVVTTDGTTVPHQLNLVFNKEENTFSFDDITSVIVDRGSAKEFFNYDIVSANSLNQGNSQVMEQSNWIAMPSDLLYYLVGRKDNGYNNFGYKEVYSDMGLQMPKNIKKINEFKIEERKYR